MNFLIRLGLIWAGIIALSMQVWGLYHLIDAGLWFWPVAGYHKAPLTAGITILIWFTIGIAWATGDES